MKKALVSILTFLLSTSMLFSCVIGLTACSNNNTNENPPVTNFSVDLTGYVANVGNATALGIMKLDSNNGSQVDDNRVSPMSVKLFTEDVEEKNYIVKSNMQYNANNPELSESGIEKISFTKTTTENVTTITRGTKYILAKENMDKQNCSISFASVKDFTYSIYLNDTCLLDNVLDNDNNDINKEIGVIEIDGLEKDKEYAVKYSGVGEETTITQDEIEGEIDKLYVLNDYTFISFVPKGESKRPANDVLTYDTDGIATYDKCNYFSNGIDRQSFVIDNTTGYVYDLKGFNIKAIEGGCLLSANDNYIYDFKINANDEVEIFSLFTNDSIEWYSCFKDKYGNKYIQNNRLNKYDETTNTYFYVFEPFTFGSENGDYHKGIDYELTENNEAIKLIYGGDIDGSSNSMTDAYFVIDARIMLNDGNERKLTENDNFKIYYDSEKYLYTNDSYGSEESRAVYKVEKGVIYGYSHFLGYGQGFTMMKYDAVNDKPYCWGCKWNDAINYFNVEFLEEYNVIIEFLEGKLYYYNDIWSSYNNIAPMYDKNEANSQEYYYLHYYTSDSLIEVESFCEKKLLDECSIENNAVLCYGINGNTYYDIVVEEVGGEIVVNQYIKGTYVKPQIKVILQPLNK